MLEIGRLNCSCWWLGYLLFCFNRIAMIMPYIPSTPAITTGMIDLKIRSGLRTATATIPTPDLAVP